MQDEVCTIKVSLFYRIYEAVHERQGKNAKELTVEKGDIVQVKFETNRRILEEGWDMGLMHNLLWEENHV